MVEVNKKIVGAKKTEFDGIRFDSRLELSCYKALKKADLDFKYNNLTFNLLSPFRLEGVHLYDSSNKRRIYGEQLTKSGLKRQFIGIKYTPDFVRDVEGEPLIIIETKGFSNDVYPYKKKMFLKSLEKVYKKTGREVYFFEPKNLKEINRSIEIIKLRLSEERL